MDESAGVARRKRPAYATVAWVLLIVLAVFPIVASVLDLVADGRTGIPADHQGSFVAIAGTSWQEARTTAPGVSAYVTLLERGYALHELTFGLLLLVLVAIPLRRGAPWAWWACWLTLVADLGYTFTFGTHDATILSRALIADILLPVALLGYAPFVFARSRT